MLEVVPGPGPHLKTLSGQRTRAGHVVRREARQHEMRRRGDLGVGVTCPGGSVHELAGTLLQLPDLPELLECPHRRGTGDVALEGIAAALLAQPSHADIAPGDGLSPSGR